jgi:hypothetical protein
VIYQAPQDVLQTYIPGLASSRNCPADPAVITAIRIQGTHALGGLDAVDRAIVNARGKTVIVPGNPMVH